MVDADRSLTVERWSCGDQSRITPPSLEVGNRYHGKVVVATFHTHPNPPVDENGEEWEQAPGEADKRWHARRRLRGFVVSRDLVYEIDVDGNVSMIGSRHEVLSS